MNLMSIMHLPIQDELKKLALQESSRLNWRRDSIRHLLEKNNINLNFSMAELKTFIKELEKQNELIYLLLLNNKQGQPEKFEFKSEIERQNTIKELPLFCKFETKEVKAIDYQDEKNQVIICQVDDLLNHCQELMADIKNIRGCILWTASDQIAKIETIKEKIGTIRKDDLKINS